jgi:hypothetical protein
MMVGCHGADPKSVLKKKSSRRRESESKNVKTKNGLPLSPYYKRE